MIDVADRMTGGEAVVAALRAHGVTTLFGLPGVQLDGLFNALHGAQDWLRVINARHEQGVAYMALGYAAATGRPGVFAVVPGPGMLNAGAALATAYTLHAPVLALVGQIASNAIGAGFGELHELLVGQLSPCRGGSKCLFPRSRRLPRLRERSIVGVHGLAESEIRGRRALAVNHQSGHHNGNQHYRRDCG